MKFRIYLLATMWLILGVLLFIFGYNKIDVDHGHVSVVLFCTVVCAFSVRSSKESIKIWSGIFIVSVVSLLGVFKGQDPMSTDVLRWLCIGLIGSGALLMAVPFLMKRNLFASFGILLIEGIVLICTRGCFSDNFFVTKEFFWCTYFVLFVAFLVLAAEWGYQGYLGIKEGDKPIIVEQKVYEPGDVIANDRILDQTNLYMVTTARENGWMTVLGSIMVLIVDLVLIGVCLKFQ